MATNETSAKEVLLVLGPSFEKQHKSCSRSCCYIVKRKLHLVLVKPLETDCFSVSSSTTSSFRLDAVAMVHCTMSMRCCIGGSRKLGNLLQDVSQRHTNINDHCQRGFCQPKVCEFLQSCMCSILHDDSSRPLERGFFGR